MNIFKKIRDAKYNAMDRIEKIKKDYSSTQEDLNKEKSLRLKVEERKKLSDNMYKEKEKRKKAEVQLRKRTPAYRVINALKDNIKKNKKNKSKFGSLPTGKNFDW